MRRGLRNGLLRLLDDRDIPIDFQNHIPLRLYNALHAAEHSYTAAAFLRMNEPAVPFSLVLNSALNFGL